MKSGFQIMSLFSSLSHFFNKAASAINQTSAEPHPNIIPKESTSSNRLSLIAESESLTNDITNYNRYFNLTMSKENFSKAETSNSFDSPTEKKWGNLISLFTSISKASLEIGDAYTSGSNVYFPNETYPNAEYLLESWWNIFDKRYLRHSWGWTITLIIAYISVLVAGVIGNLMVILVVLLRPQMRTVTNIFITNLAVADLFVIVFCVPSALLANIFAPWILGSFMCKAVAYVQGISVCASSYSLAAISVDRCQAVYRNYERPRGFSQMICIRTIFIIWMVALSLTIPRAVIFDIKVSEYDGFRYCVEAWKDENNGNIYFIAINVVSFYAIPLLLIIVSNWIIYCHVMHRHVPQKSASSAAITKLHRHTRHVVLRMLGIVTLTFLLCWLPLYVLVIGIKFSESITESEYKLLGILMPIAQWLGSGNSSINPILFAFLNKKYRRMFKSILPAWIPVKLDGKYQGSIKTPSFTHTAYTGRSLGRSRGANSRSDYHYHNYHSHNQANVILGRFLKRSATIATAATTTVQLIATNVPTTAVFISDSLDNIFESAIAENILPERITDL